MKKIHHYYWLDFVLLTLVLGTLFTIFLGHHALFTPDEARYAEISREMVISRDYITPRLNFILYLEKPIFFYWLNALSIKLFGYHEWAVRLATAYFAIMGCLINYHAGCKLYNRATGWFAALILATSFLYFTMGHLASLDMTVSTLITSSLFSFLIGTREKMQGKRRIYIWAAFICASLAVLTKGLIGLLFPTIIVGLWVMSLNLWKELKHWFLPSSILLFLCLILPWHLLIQIKHPFFSYFYFIEHHFLRYSTLSANRFEPWYYYMVVFLIGLLPWTLFLIQSIKKINFKWSNRKEQATELFLFLWIGVIFLFFSLSKSKLIPYILPIFPPTTLLIGHYFSTLTLKKTPGAKLGFAILPFISLLIFFALMAISRYHFISNPTLAIHSLFVSAIIIFIAYSITSILFWQCNVKIAFTSLFIGTALFLISILINIPHIDYRSIKPLTTIINQQTKPDDLVIAYNHYYQDLPFYTKRKVIVVNCKNELAFGMQHQDTSTWMMTTADFWEKWKTWSPTRRLFILTRLTDYHTLLKEHPTLKIYKLGTTSRNVLISNRSNSS